MENMPLAAVRARTQLHSHESLLASCPLCGDSTLTQDPPADRARLAESALFTGTNRIVGRLIAFA